MYEYENGFSALLDELENLHDKRGNHMGGLRKSHTPPVYRIAKVTRSEPVAFKNLMPLHHHDFSGEMDGMIADLNKSMRCKPRAATISRKSRRMDLRKALTDFNTNLRKAMASGDLTPDQVCLLEARRNRMMQRPMTGLT